MVLWVTQNVYFLLSTYMKQLLLVILCDTTAGIGYSNVCRTLVAVETRCFQKRVRVAAALSFKVVETTVHFLKTNYLSVARIFQKRQFMLHQAQKSDEECQTSNTKGSVVNVVEFYSKAGRFLWIMNKQLNILKRLLIPCKTS